MLIYFKEWSVFTRCSNLAGCMNYFLGACEIPEGRLRKPSVPKIHMSLVSGSKASQKNTAQVKPSFFLKVQFGMKVREGHECAIPACFINIVSQSTLAEGPLMLLQELASIPAWYYCPVTAPTAPTHSICQ